MRKAVCILFAAVAVVSAAWAAAEYDQSSFSSFGRMFEPCPNGHTVGKDNISARGTHHPGEDCGYCHRSKGRASSYLWTMSGTIYTDRAAREPLPGAEIILKDRNGNVISMTSNSAGNFWTAAPIASNPYTVSSNHGGPPFTPLYIEDSLGNLLQPADPQDPRTWRYKTWARKGKDIRPMMTIGGIGANETLDRMTCNMHHAGTGSRGALWASRTATLASYPAKGISYRKHISAIIRSKCSPCHIPGSTKTAVMTKSDLGTPSTSIDFSSSLDLMNYEGSTVGTFVKLGIASAIDTASPERSLLLVKTTGEVTHAGGVFWSGKDADYQVLRQWIAEGGKQ